MTSSRRDRGRRGAGARRRGRALAGPLAALLLATVLATMSGLARASSAPSPPPSSALPTYCYPTAACNSGGSGDFDSRQRKICRMLATAEYCAAPTSDAVGSCSAGLRYHGWCNANRYVINSGCLTRYPTTSSTACENCNFDSYATSYWSVGAPYPVHPGMVNQGLRTCVITYVKEELRQEYLADNIVMSDASLTSLALQEFPEEQMEDADDYNEQYSSYYLTSSDIAELTSEESIPDEVDGEMMENTITTTKQKTSCAGGGKDEQCFEICPSHLGLRDEYKISIPKVCAKIKFLGKRFKKCIKVPSVKFKIPSKCAEMCVNIPGFCEMEAALNAVANLKNVNSASSAITLIENLGVPSSVTGTMREGITAVSSLSSLRNVNSVQDLVNTGRAIGVPASITNEITSGITAVQNIATLATKTTVDGVLQIGLLHQSLLQVIDDAQKALQKVADNLENELRGLVQHVWGEAIGAADDLKRLIDSAVKNAVKMSSTASLGAAHERRRSMLANDIREGVSAAFKGNIAPERAAGAFPSVADLGSSEGCLEIVIETEKFTEDFVGDDGDFQMPWPKKFENISAAPGSLIFDFPKLTFALCAAIDEFNVDSAVATAMLNAFAKMFDAFFDALYEESGLKDIVDEVKELGSGKFFTGRRLLTARDEQYVATKHAELKGRLAAAETKVLVELLSLSERIHSPAFFASQPNPVASLGASAFEEVFIDFADDMEDALKLMAETTSIVSTFSLKVALETAITVKMGITKTGDIFKDHLDLDSTIAGVKVVPIAPGLLATIDYEFSLDLPYYFQVDASGTYKIAVEVTIPVDLTLSKTPSVSFGPVQVVPTQDMNAQVVAGLQIGAVATIQKAYVALCSGPVCVGPQLHARQDVYFGLDAYAQLNCESGPATLAPMWSETFTYSQTTQDACTGSLFGAGGYLQVPKTSEIEVPILLRPLPTGGGGGVGTAASTAARLGAKNARTLSKKTKSSTPAPESPTPAPKSPTPAPKSPTPAPKGAPPSESSPDVLSITPDTDSVELYDLTPFIAKLDVFASGGDWHAQDLFHACGAPKCASQSAQSSAASSATLGSVQSEFKSRAVNPPAVVSSSEPRKFIRLDAVGASASSAPFSSFSVERVVAVVTILAAVVDAARTRRKLNHLRQRDDDGDHAHTTAYGAC
jgi:hypothetical protein